MIFSAQNGSSIVNSIVGLSLFESYRVLDIFNLILFLKHEKYGECRRVVESYLSRA